MILGIRDTNSCQQDRTRPFTYRKRSYKTYVSISEANTRRKKYEDIHTYKSIKRESNAIKGWQARQKLPRRPGHEFKFWSMDIVLNTISDEMISMNQISVEPI